jgi:hypothetical protein
MGARAFAISSALVASLAAVVACGPSFQVVYEGDARFEHCYALDETASVPMAEKTDCWTQWMKSYTYGQTRNRVDYASTRAKALREVPVMPTDEAVMSAAPGEGLGRVGRDLPVTTNAFEAPPKTMAQADAGRRAVSPPEGAEAKLETAADEPPQQQSPQLPLGAIVPQTTPREPCTDRCRSEWQTCRATCRGKCGACDRSYGGCMKRCF